MNLFLPSRFFLIVGGLVVCFALGFPIPILYTVARLGFIVFLGLILVDAFLLFNKNTQVKVRRRLPRLFGLGDDNPVRIELTNLSNLPLSITLIDELPIQLQIRDFQQKLQLDVNEQREITYQLHPVERGEYEFGAVVIFMRSVLGILEKRYRHVYPMSVAVYPSIAQMKQYELRAFDRISQFQGIKKLRRIGHSYEFEQIKNYVRGDDYRSINWKATGRRSSLMVNQYEDERAQQIYSIIDKSRNMRMPFAGLSLMDYAINTCLAVSNIALRKHDRAGLITFSDKIGATIKADSKATQLNKILTALYREDQRPLEANYELLYHAARKLINGRSLLLFFTNFESSYALERVLPLLRRINNLHLLVVIFFENTEIRDFAEKEAHDIEDIYHQTIAQKFLAEKSQMVQILRQYGIQTVLTRPEDLSINTINKYLELKSKGLI
ncbi:MAG: DUF58 domain-containing protein [Saprospiraceae bacterium]|nr:DUF58 domain-containing protein [Lewinella sp.]